jgi:acyl CoA:acetate/3-ketoacid CoA transferase beta subunit
VLQEQEFQLCRDYLRKHPKVTLQEVSENTGIPLKIMMSWIREGRLRV